MITDYQKIAAVAQVTGKLIRLGMMETVSDFILLEDQVLITINRAQVTEKRNELIITQRGFTLWTFYLQGGEWRYPEPVTYWHEDFTTEVHKTYTTCAEEHVAQKVWEDLCHRPGTPTHPMDNVARQEQGY